MKINEKNDCVETKTIMLSDLKKMKLSKDFLKNTHDKAWEIVEYANSNDSIMIDGEDVDINEKLFNSTPYPFDLSFDELLTQLDEVFEKNIESIYIELGESFVYNYVNYVNNLLIPIYNTLNK